ncbi:hypothetical protein F3J23_19025 [Chryseobacterium sp. Tr-659]|uniref:hypothetical protein n=1 Tax=Chryseobacterium sp. Tr-659 TaxID=2608340 RepID=UPI001422D588|nr:hypothetical protein [Chryseobacterium sp. Tr-659]NIF07519.1 hypothetical protein [Chryseobacterium sp. Tr-659]
MKRLNLDFLLSFFIYCWVLYTLYTVIISFYDLSHIKHITWKQAENQSTVYSSRRSTTVTYNFVKDNIRISRKYPGIFEGINTWMWGINKDDDKVDIAFYIREKDNERIEKHEIKHRRDIFGGELNELESIPFFGLRKIDVKINRFFLLSDIWKYNYRWWVFLIFLLTPHLLILLAKKTGLFQVDETENKLKHTGINDYIFWTLSIINIINFLI